MQIKRQAFSLVEILIASAILAVVGVPMISVFITSKNTVSRTDARRSARYYVREIFAHLSRQSLHDLWTNFGPGEVMGYDVAGKLRHHLVNFDDPTGQIPVGGDPLGFGKEFISEMFRDGYDARVFFEFYTRKELEITPAIYRPNVQDKPSPRFGVLHMQAGWAIVYILDRNKLAKTRSDEKAVVAEWKQPIMCPAIVGRPGLKLSGCPAVNVEVRSVFEPLLRRRESL